LRAEQRLVEQAKAGDTDAFELLARMQIDRLYGAARLITGDADIAHDAVQGALIRAWRGLGKLRSSERFGPWLQRLLVRSCHDELRRDRRWSAKLRLVRPDERWIEPSDLAERDVVIAALRRVSLEHRTVLVLHFYLGLAPSEIGTRLGIPGGTARSRLHYALAAVRAELEADERAGRGGARELAR
jgi:RNA polymerase sigma-70 factor (ECF subfamily)